MRWPAVVIDRFCLVLLSLVLVTGCTDDRDSESNDDPNGASDVVDMTSHSDASAGPLSQVSLEGLQLPEPATEGPLCVKLSASEEMAIDSVSIESASGDDVFYTFSDVMVDTSASQNCTTACFCQGPNPPKLDVRLAADGNERVIESGASAPAGCCESQ